MPAPFTITPTKSRDNFTFEEYYKLLEEIKQTYGVIDPTLNPSSPTYVNDVRQAYGQPTKPDIVKKFEDLLSADVTKITREYIGLLRGFLVQKYPRLAPAIQNVSQIDNRIQREFLSIPEMQRYLTLNGYNSYVQYWQAYQDYRAITPKLPLRGTIGTEEQNNPIVFGYRNANLFAPYIITPTVTPNPTQINRQTAQQQQQNQLQQQRTNLTK
jgi:hypothetical protein